MREIEFKLRIQMDAEAEKIFLTKLLQKFREINAVAMVMSPPNRPPSIAVQTNNLFSSNEDLDILSVEAIVKDGVDTNAD